MSHTEVEHEVLPQRERRVRNRGGLEENNKKRRIEKPENEIDMSRRGVSLIDAETALRAENALPKQDEAADLPHISMPTYRESAVGTHSFEYLDHTADIQIHSWGPTLAIAFQNAALGMYNYMTPLEQLDITNQDSPREFEAQGHDLDSLLFSFLDELLFQFHTDQFVCKTLDIYEFDTTNYIIKAKGMGDIFSRDKHECGTEIKAITYSAMQILEKPGDCEVFVIVDI